MTEYIERESLMRRIKEIHCAECDNYHGVRCRSCWVDDTLGYIDSEPPADVALVRHGRWIEGVVIQTDIAILYDYTCPLCGIVSDRNSNYCPNCGAKMDGGADNG